MVNYPSIDKLNRNVWWSQRSTWIHLSRFYHSASLLISLRRIQSNSNPWLIPSLCMFSVFSLERLPSVGLNFLDGRTRMYYRSSATFLSLPPTRCNLDGSLSWTTWIVRIRFFFSRWVFVLSAIWNWREYRLTIANVNNYVSWPKYDNQNKRVIQFNDNRPSNIITDTYRTKAMAYFLSISPSLAL